MALRSPGLLGGEPRAARRVHQSVEARDATVVSGMGGGVREGYEKLDELLARLVPVG